MSTQGIEIWTVEPTSGTVWHAKQEKRYLDIKLATLGYGIVDARFSGDGDRVVLKGQPCAVRSESEADDLLEAIDAEGGVLGIHSFEKKIRVIEGAKQMSWSNEGL